MDTTSSPTPPVYTSAPSRGVFGTNVPSSVAFAVGILLFLLPFAEIKCGSTPLMNKSGLNFAMGKEWKAAKQNNMFGGNEMSKKSMSDGEKESGNAQYFAIIALALGVLGLILSFSNAKTGGGAGIALGILSAGGLIALMVDLKKNFNDSMKKQAMDKGEEAIDAFKDVKISLEFTPWFYVAILAFVVAAIFCYLRTKSAKI